MQGHNPYTLEKQLKATRVCLNKSSVPYTGEAEGLGSPVKALGGSHPKTTKAYPFLFWPLPEMSAALQAAHSSDSPDLTKTVQVSTSLEHSDQDGA